MATIQSLTQRVRMELGDYARPFQNLATGDGLARRFEVPNPTGDLLISVAGTPVTLDVDFTLDPIAGLVTFDFAPALGADIVLSGTAFTYFRDFEYATFVQEAYNFHTSGRDLPMDRLPEIEVPLVAWMATVEALWALLADASGDIDIRTPEGMTIPRSQRVGFLTNLIEMYEMRYKRASAQLNVGLHRIEQFTLRRTSKRTGRLVPVYVSQEVDDRSPATQVWPEIDTGELGG